LTGEEIDTLLGGGKIIREDPSDADDTPPPSSVPSTGSGAQDEPGGGFEPSPQGA